MSIQHRYQRSAGPQPRNIKWKTKIFAIVVLVVCGYWGYKNFFGEEEFRSEDVSMENTMQGDTIEDPTEEKEEEKEEDDFYKGAAKKIEIEDDFDDPLDKPAFMRKMFGKKK